MAASIFANASALRFGAKSEDLQGRPGTGSVIFSVALQRYNTEDEWWAPIAQAGSVYARTPTEITFGDITTEGLAALPESIQDWQTAQAGDRIVLETGEDADITFATINLV